MKNTTKITCKKEFKGYYKGTFNGFKFELNAEYCESVKWVSSVFVKVNGEKFTLELGQNNTKKSTLENIKYIINLINNNQFDLNDVDMWSREW